MNKSTPSLPLRFLSSFMRRAPESLRHWRLQRLSLQWSRGLSESTRDAVVMTRYGYRIKVPLSDWLGQHVYATGDYEPPTSKLISQIVAPGDCVIDIGANIGFFTLLLAKQVGPTGHVFSFEAIPDLRAAIESNIRLDQFENISLFDTAASDREGTFEFFLGPESHLGISSLRPIQRASESIQVKTTPLDCLGFEKHRIAMAKIDVEGAELAVLRGMREILDRDHPDLVLEVTDKFLNEFGDSGEELFELLQSFGYKIYEICDEGLKLVPSWSDELSEQFNAFFTCRQTFPENIHFVK